MDYSLIVGIHDCDREDQDYQDHNMAPVEEEEDEGLSENGLEDEEGEGVGGLGSVPTPPDSPQPSPYPPFNGELDIEMERYALRCSAGKYTCRSIVY